MLKAWFCYLSVLFFLVSLTVMASPVDDVGLETISISADEASEDIQPGVLHFKGHFIMQTRRTKFILRVHLPGS